MDALQQLVTDNNRMRRAGDELAAAALRVVHDYDGVHRLRLAVAEWSRTVACEGGRDPEEGET